MNFDARKFEALLRADLRPEMTSDSNFGGISITSDR